MQQNRIVFIGGGNIAEAIFARLDASSQKIIVIDHNPDRLKYLTDHYSHIKFIAKLDITTDAQDIVILAIKPQNAKDVCLNLQLKINKSTIVSVMAGVTSQSLGQWLTTDRIVRAMPNTPAILGHGITGIYFSPKILEATMLKIQSIFNAVGKSYVFATEDHINKITAISASAPAYVFYFIESLIESAINNFDFSEVDAREITLQVLKGSMAMLATNANTPVSQLRSNVTSKKGTTAAATTTFEANNFKQIISDAEVACYNRAIELGALYK